MQSLAPVVVLVLAGACAAPTDAQELPNAGIMVSLSTDRVLHYRALDHWCTAFAVGPCQVLTAAHCVGTRAELHGADGVRAVVATVAHSTADVALLTVERSFQAWFELSEYDAPDIHSLGYGAGYGCDGVVRGAAGRFHTSYFRVTGYTPQL
jgi:hypothetical protein